MSNANETVLTPDQIREMANELCSDRSGMTGAYIFNPSRMGLFARAIEKAALATQGAIANAAVLGADERTQFEDALLAYFLDKYPHRDLTPQNITDWRGGIEGDYLDRPVVHGMWQGWKLRASQQSAQPSDTPAIVITALRYYAEGKHIQLDQTGVADVEYIEQGTQAQRALDAIAAAPQVAQPSAESKHDFPNDVAHRYADLACDLVQLIRNAGEGICTIDSAVERANRHIKAVREFQNSYGKATPPTVDQDGVKDASISDVSAMRIAAECGVFCTSPQAIAFADAVIKTSIRKSGEQDGVKS